MDTRELFTAKLLGSEATSPRFQEYRNMLEVQLKQAELKAKRGSRYTKIAWGVVGTLAAVGIAGSMALPMSMKPIATSLWMLAYFLMWLALLRTFMYLVFERRAFEVAKGDFRDAMIVELVQRVDRLTVLIAKTSHSSTE